MEGLPGILVSPTHGLLVYSPVFLFAIVGSAAVWRSSDIQDDAINIKHYFKYSD